MADILIKNIELPLEERIQLSIYPNGIVVNHSTLKIGKNRTTAIELPEHGRLCDLDALIEHETYNIEQALFDSDEVLEDLKNTPVIVEATNG